MFIRYLVLDAVYVFTDQHARNGANPSLNTNYNSYGMTLRWAFNGRGE